MTTISVPTSTRNCFIDITKEVKNVVRRSGVQSGLCVVHTPHTTAAVTINENADPDVLRDLVVKYCRIAPASDGYVHAEGNSDAHVKSSMIGCSLTLIIDRGELALGTWQGIYFGEFDGPRQRQVYVQCLG